MQAARFTLASRQVADASRSPIKAKPLRQAWQSLDEEWHSIWDNKLEPLAVMAIGMMAMAVYDWIHYILNSPPTPFLSTGVALVALGYAAFRIWRTRPKMRQIRQGIEGERAVGQYLERLRADGYHVFHDVLGESFNIDHILIGPAGAFTVETKTWSKPARGQARITIDDGRVLANGRELDRDPIVQARAQARWLRELLRESTGKTIPVHPIVAFPGWFVEQPSIRMRDLWVLEPKAIPSFLANEPQRLTDPDVSMASLNLSRLIRSAEKDRGVG